MDADLARAQEETDSLKFRQWKEKHVGYENGVVREWIEELEEFVKKVKKVFQRTLNKYPYGFVSVRFDFSGFEEEVN